jgi:hypothetical protein
MAEALIQRLYDSEINLTVQFSSFYDGGFTVKIGDELNGFRAEEGAEMERRWEVDAHEGYRALSRQQVCEGRDARRWEAESSRKKTLKMRRYKRGPLAKAGGLFVLGFGAVIRNWPRL